MDELNDILKQQAKDLLLTPSPIVWLKVEADIERREKRRVWLFALLLLVALLIGSLAFYYAIAWRYDDNRTHKIPINKIKSSISPVKQNGKSQHPHSNTDPIVSLTRPFFSSNNAGKSIILTDSLNEIPSKTDTPFIKKMLTEVQVIHPIQINAGLSFPAKTTKSIVNIKHESVVVAPVKSEAQEHISPLPSAINTKHRIDTIQSPLADKIPKPVLVNIGNDVQPADDVTTNNVVTTKSEELFESSKNESSSGKAQEAQHEEKNKKDCWAVSFSLAPVISFSKLKEQSDSQFIEKSRNDNSRNLVSTDYNFKLYYKALPYLEVYSGLGIHNMGERIATMQDIYDKGPVTGPTSAGIKKQKVALTADSSGYLSNRFSYCEIALGMRFRFINHRKISAYFDVGISINKLLRASGYYYDSTLLNYQPMDKNRLQSWLFSYSAGLSLQYAIKDQLRLELMPYYRTTPSSVIKEDHKLGQYIQQAGLCFSLRYQFKKNRKK